MKLMKQRGRPTLKWDREDKMLILGESVAVVTAIAAIPVELSNWPHGKWLLISSTIIGTSALLFYAFMLVLRGEKPLTGRSAQKIRQVVFAMEIEQQGVVFDWDNIDEDGGIPMDLTNWSKLTPEGRAGYKRLGYDRGFLTSEKPWTEHGTTTGQGDG